MTASRGLKPSSAWTIDFEKEARKYVREKVGVCWETAAFFGEQGINSEGWKVLNGWD